MVEQFEQSWSAFGPHRTSTLHQIVARLGGGEHAVLAQGVLSELGGLVGDRWRIERDAERVAQLSLMDLRVARLIGGLDGPYPGDNLIVDLDLSEQALPAGTRLRVGSAIIEITPEPHTGCKIFASRFGVDALKWINSRERRALRLRGIHARVVQGGTVTPGDAIEVVLC